MQDIHIRFFLVHYPILEIVRNTLLGKLNNLETFFISIILANIIAVIFAKLFENKSYKIKTFFYKRMN